MSENEKRRTPEVYLTPQDVSDRYNGKLGVQTLANWRITKIRPRPGPVYIKAGGKVLYALSDLERWEASIKSDSDD